MKEKKLAEKNQSTQVVFSTGGKSVTPEEAINLTEIMLSEQNFTTVNLSNSHIPLEAFGSISIGMLGNRSITSIDISNNSTIGTTIFSKDAMLGSPDNEIHPSFQTFQKAIRANPITDLDLSNTNITADHLKGLATALHGKPLKFLNLANNVFLGDHNMSNHDATTRAFGHIAEIVSNHNLISLDLSYLKASEVMLPLAKALTNHPSLTELELRGNSFATENIQVGSNSVIKVSRSFNEIIDAITSNKALKYLGLSNIGMNINCLQKILKSNNKTLKSLDISHNPIWNTQYYTITNEKTLLEKIKDLQDLLSWKSKIFDSLDISNTIPFSLSGGSVNLINETAKMLGAAFGKTHQIKTLDLSGNMLTDKAVSYLIKVFGTDSSLDKLDLSNNNFTAASTVMIEQILDPHTTLVLSSRDVEHLEPFKEKGRGNYPEIYEARKTLLFGKKLPKVLVKCIEKFYNDGLFGSGKFVVPGHLKEIGHTSVSSKEIDLSNILEQIFVNSVESPVVPSGMASNVVTEYLGKDFTGYEQIEITGDSSSNSGGGLGNDVVVHV